MKQLATLLIAVLLLPELVTAQSLPQVPQSATSSDADAAWNRLSMLDPDAEVSIASSIASRAHWPLRCQNLRATDQGLSCQIGWMYTRSIDLPRSEVEEVSLDHDRRNFWIGVGAMSALGFALGATESSPGPPRVSNGLLGAGVVGLVSSPFVLMVVDWIPGKTIYRKPLRHAHGSH
jgi:hypothetical protein